MFSPLEQFNSIIVLELFYLDFPRFFPMYGSASFGGFVMDFSVFNLVIPIILVRYFFYFFFTYFSFSVYYLIPKTFSQRLLEIKLIFIFNLIKQQLGHNYYRYLIFIFSIFYGILLLNLLSLLPLGVALTSHIELMVFLSLSLGLGIFLVGLEKKGLKFF